MQRDEQLAIGFLLWQAIQINMALLLEGKKDEAQEGMLKVDAILDKLEGKKPDA